MTIGYNEALSKHYEEAVRRLTGFSSTRSRPLFREGKAVPGAIVTFPIYDSQKEQQVAPTLHVKVIEARDGAAAQVDGFVGGWHYVATGASKRNKGEIFKTGVGERLAVARALENLAKEIRKGIK